MAKKTMGQRLRDAGFDLSYYNRSGGPGNGYWKVRCSQCEALVINGMPTHETGCPNIVKDEKEEED
jgi:hypothetical protein